MNNYVTVRELFCALRMRGLYELVFAVPLRGGKLILQIFKDLKNSRLVIGFVFAKHLRL
jgi:hypothetical protein